MSKVAAQKKMLATLRFVGQKFTTEQLLIARQIRKAIGLDLRWDEVATALKMSERKCRYLVAVLGYVESAKVSTADVERAGWTKLSVLATYTDPEEWPQFRKTCFVLSVGQLRDYLNDPTEGLKKTEFRLTKVQERTVMKALRLAGGKTHNRQLSGLTREEALLRIIKEWLA